MDKLLRIIGFIPYTAMIFLNAFVDLGHKIVIQNTVFKIYEGQTQVILTAIVNGLILLPFILLFSPAGFLSDRFAKPRVMRASAWAALGITLGITLCYYLGWFQMAFAMTFLLAIQSAIYSPAKYGYIKELVGQDQLAVANAVVQATTTVAILSGVFLYSVLFERHLAGVTYTGESGLLRAIAPIGWVLVASTLAELYFAYRLPRHEAADAGRRFDCRHYVTGRYLAGNLRAIFANRVIWLSIVGLSVFWAISQVVLASFPAFAKETLSETNTVVIQGLLACAGVGIVIGSTLAGRASRNYIETGLIPLGAIGIVVTLILIPRLTDPTSLSAVFLALGVAGGLFVIPLNALIQFHARDAERGTVMAGNNWVQNVVMLSFLGLTVAFSAWGLDSIGLFHILTIVALAGAIYTVTQLPQSLVRYVLATLMRGRYRVRVLGFDHIPQQGAVLMLGNHISWLDWAMVQIASPRPVRFVMQREIYARWYLKWIMDFFGVVPISSGRSREALNSINCLLRDGEVVCLFPEGTISRNGQIGRFQRGFEKAVAGAEGVILPFYLQGLWGSRFSHSGERLQRNTGRGIKRDVIVAFGSPLPLDSTAETVKQRVFDLSIEAWGEFARNLDTLPREWIRTVKRQGGSDGVIDTSAGTLSHRKTLTAAIAFSRLIERRSHETNIGVLLPSSAAGIIINMAVLLRGKTVVNLNYTADPVALHCAMERAGITSIYTSKRFLSKLGKKGLNPGDALSGAKILHLEDLKAEISGISSLLVYGAVALLPSRVVQALFAKRVPAESPAAILFSSGSEGAPKGVVLSHRNIMSNISQVSAVLDTCDDDVVMGILPLFHAFGMTVTSFLPLIEGLPVVCHPDPSDAVNVGKAIARYKATILCGTSTFLRLYARNRRVQPAMLESLRVVVAGAERLSPDVREAFSLKFSKPVFEGYGATETAPVASVNIPDRLDRSHMQVQHGAKQGTVGLPLPGSSFRIVDPQTLDELPAGKDGLILIGGPQVMTGYLADEAKTTEVLIRLDEVTWYKTGDKGHVDSDGFLTIVDRYSRFAKIGGEMISLGAVEEQVRHLAGLEGQDLVAVNLPDGKKGEKVVLMVTGVAETSGVRERLIAGGCNPLMIPAGIHHVESVPKLGSGKTDFAAAKRAALGLESA
ncbi:MAG: acyl-[ACP]--phospholipid O-acyltransferase [Pseudomonadota bacterium]|nr:acyl-[ACP]--phospholipid O-acyltransferase [Pseudomonadota bacterium]